MLGHGSNAGDWNGKFLTELAAALAAEGKLVPTCVHTICSAVFFVVMEIKLCNSAGALFGTGYLAFTCITVFAGFLVVRCYCKQKEQRRQRMFEKALDAAATSPFARGITRWLLAGAWLRLVLLCRCLSKLKAARADTVSVHQKSVT